MSIKHGIKAYKYTQLRTIRNVEREQTEHAKNKRENVKRTKERNRIITVKLNEAPILPVLSKKKKKKKKT